MIRHIKQLFSRKKSVSKKELEYLKENIAYSFNTIRSDIEEQKKWINHLHSSHKDLHALSSVLDDKHKHHQRVHNKDIENLNKWVTHLHDSTKKQEDAMREMESNLSMAFEKYNQYLVDLYKIVMDLKTTNAQPSTDAHSRPETRLDAQVSTQTAENYNQPIMSNQPLPESVDEELSPLEKYSKILTRSEKNIIAEMCNTSQKLSYKDLAMVTNLSSNTVKNHICHIKNKGFPIHEKNDRSGIKRYFVPDNIRNVLLAKNM
jgi:biotin operon repressor/chaperonin cofactor prefoldin